MVLAGACKFGHGVGGFAINPIHPLLYSTKGTSPAARLRALARKENTQRVLYSGPGQRVLYAPFARFFGVILRAFNSPTVDCARFFTADSHTGEKQSLRKADKTLIVDFNLLTVLRVL